MQAYSAMRTEIIGCLKQIVMSNKNEQWHHCRYKQKTESTVP